MSIDKVRVVRVNPDGSEVDLSGKSAARAWGLLKQTTDTLAFAHHTGAIGATDKSIYDIRRDINEGLRASTTPQASLPFPEQGHGQNRHGLHELKSQQQQAPPEGQSLANYHHEKPRLFGELKKYGGALDGVPDAQIAAAPKPKGAPLDHHEKDVAAVKPTPHPGLRLNS